MKANHNSGTFVHFTNVSCFLYCKSTKMKANHNEQLEREQRYNAVFYIAKVLK